MAEENEKKKLKPGRPKGNLGPTVPLQVRLTPEQHGWITSQSEGASHIVRQWIDTAMDAARTGDSAEKE